MCSPHVIGLGFDTGPSGAPLAPCLTYATMAVTLLAIIRWRVTHANPNPDSDPNPNPNPKPNPNLNPNPTSNPDPNPKTRRVPHAAAAWPRGAAQRAQLWRDRRAWRYFLTT